MSEPEESVSMTLEESGLLCHVLLPHIIENNKKLNTPEEKFDTLSIRRRQLTVMTTLYEKLAKANDKLMGRE